MGYRVDVSEDADKQLKKLGAENRERLLRFLLERVPKLEDTRSIGEALRGNKLGEFWKYRVGDYRLICKIEDELVMVLVLRVGHRREVYKER